MSGQDSSRLSGTTRESTPRPVGNPPLARELPAGLDPVPGRNRRLRQALDGKDIVVAPGVFDCITAKLVDSVGFPAAYISGSGLSMSHLGIPDLGVVSFGEILERVKRIADLVSVPVIADADTGYGGPLNVIRTVKEFERAGVSAIQIEDQAWPKKCGHEPGRKIAPAAEMVARLKAAVDARTDPDFLIIARTDARSTLGLGAAIERANLYREAGADVLFVESPESEAELEQVAREVSGPVLANMVEGGRTPILPYPRLAEIGYRIAIFPNSLTRLLGRMGLLLLEELKASGTTAAMAGQMMGHRELWDLFESGLWVGLEQRFQTET